MGISAADRGGPRALLWCRQAGGPGEVGANVSGVLPRGSGGGEGQLLSYSCLAGRTLTVKRTRRRIRMSAGSTPACSTFPFVFFALVSHCAKQERELAVCI